MATARDRFRPIAPTEAESRLAEDSSRRLAPLARARRDLRVQVVNDDAPSEPMTIPAAVVEILLHVLSEMALGRAVSVTPVREEMTTQEAADFLNVSRPHLIKLLDRGEIPFRKVGSHRRISVAALNLYRERADAEQERALADLARQAEELDMGY